MKTDRTIKLAIGSLLCMAAAMPAMANQDPPKVSADDRAAVEGPVGSKTPSAPKQSANPVNIRGDLIFIMLAGHSSQGLWGLTKTGRIAGRRDFVAVGMARTLQMYHNVNVTLDGDVNDGAYWKLSTNASNAYSFDTLLDNWNRPMLGLPYGEPEENNVWFDEANFRFATEVRQHGVDVTIGRFYHSSGPYFLARPYYAEFYENPRVNNGQHIFDGFRTVSNLGSSDLTVLLARVDKLMYSNGREFTSLTGETLFGLELDFEIGDNGRAKLVRYWERDDDTGTFVGAGEDQMRTFGAQLSFAFSEFDVSGTFAQTNYYLGDSQVLNDQNAAASLEVTYNGDERWGATGRYGSVDGNFGAQGSWGRLGPYFNPANVDFFGVSGWLTTSDTTALRGGFTRYRPANSSAMGALGIMAAGDQIDSFELALDFDLGPQAYGSLGFERVDGSLLGGSPADLNWYSLDLNFLVADNATVAVHYLFSDGLMPVTSGGISNGVWSGGVLAVQGTLRF